MQDTDRQGEITSVPRAVLDRLQATDTYTIADDEVSNIATETGKPSGWNRATRRHPQETRVKVVPHAVYEATKTQLAARRAKRKLAEAGLGDARAAGTPLHMNHFATCPQAASHAKGQAA